MSKREFTIHVRWHQAHEWLHLAGPAKSFEGTRLATAEIWDEPELPDRVPYRPIIEECTRGRADRTWQLVLRYAKAENPRAAARGNTSWGWAKHIIDPEARTVRSAWRGEGEDQWVRCPAWLTDEPAGELMKFEQIRRRARRQQRLRRVVLAFGRACAITGETNPTVLDAAHINEVAGYTNFAAGNGLLLRKDLHALFDSGELHIDPDNRTLRLTGLAQASPHYRALIVQYPTLERDAFERVRERLRARTLGRVKK